MKPPTPSDPDEGDSFDVLDSSLFNKLLKPPQLEVLLNTDFPHRKTYIFYTRKIPLLPTFALAYGIFFFFHIVHFIFL